VARRTTSPFCAVAAMAEVSVPFPNSFMRVSLKPIDIGGRQRASTTVCAFRY
jgi:hypothetical protein